MSDSLATDYADSMAGTIYDDTKAVYPFGQSEEELDTFGEPEPLTAFDYLQDVLDIEYRVDSDRHYKSAKILIGYGGPNVWIDTATHELVVYWGDRVARDLPDTFIEYLDEALSEVWGMN